VLWGDVHLCGGQSNMQFTVHSAVNSTEEIKRADAYPLIRLFTVGQSSQSDVPLPELNTTEQLWSVASATSVGAGDWSEFSAVCWFTYRNVFNALAYSGDIVPQGLVSNNWGGTPIEHWSSPDALAKCITLKNVTDSVLWNAMIHPYTVGPMSFKTAIWYQGESNVGEAAYYACQFPAMIVDWRAKLPGLNTFGFVQIAGWTGYSNTYATGDLRQSMLQPLHLLPNVALSTAIDLVWPTTDPSNIHPLNKQDVSVRLASQILGIEYGVGQPLVFPTYVGASLVNYGPASLTSVDVQLRGCTGGCSVLPAFYPPGCLANTSASFMLLIADASGKVTRVNATAVPLAGMSSLRITIAAPAYPFTVFGSSYGHASYPIAHTFNAQGMPLLPWCYSLSGLPCWAIEQLQDVTL